MVRLFLVMDWFKTKTENGKTTVFDPLRKTYVALTPEEQVRQKTLFYLIETQKYPAGLIAVEYSIKVNGLAKRCDIVVFSKTGNPFMIVECKAEHVRLTEKVLDQAIRYFTALSPEYIFLTNGKTAYCYHITNEGIKAVEEVPKLSS